MSQTKKQHIRRRELLSRYGRVTNWHSSLREHADRPRGRSPVRESRATVLIEGEFTEPVGEVTRFLIQVSPTEKPELGNVEVPNVGVFISVKPEFQGVIDMTEDRFHELLTLAASSRLAWCHFAFTTPHRRSSFIISIDFTTQPPDDET